MKKHKTVLITGASKGIGKATAELFGQCGYNVAINYNQDYKNALETANLINRTGNKAIICQADISDLAQVINMFKEINEMLGSVDVLLNNAGIAQQKLFADLTENEWQRMFDINVKGAFFCTKQALPDMINHKEGRIINISSIWGLVGASCEVHYSASKAALIGMTKALAKELGLSGITVNCIAPGIIDTDMNSSLGKDVIKDLTTQIPLGRLGTTADIAKVALFLASSSASYITGQVISPNGGFLI